MEASPQNSSDDGLKSICIRVFNNQPAAEIAAANLESNGMACWTSADDCGGMMPIMGGGGVRLYVRADDVAAACAILGLVGTENMKTMPTDGLTRDYPKFIIVAGIWLICGLGLFVVGVRFGLLYYSKIDGVGRFVSFWLLAVSCAVCVYMLYRSLKNYYIQKKRATDEADN
jgi:hypothetical protein